MSELFCGSFSIGLLSYFWALMAYKFELIGWVGFIGCTSYYVSGGKVEGLTRSILCNFLGIFWAACILISSKLFTFYQAPIVFTGIFSFFMCYQAKIKDFGFIPGTFIGCSAVFGSNSTYTLVICSILCGSLLGYFSDLGGKYLYKGYCRLKKNSL